MFSEGKFKNGFYLSPTVIIGLPQTHRLFKDELFTPLIVVDEFKTLDEAIAKVNDTEYGLTAGIFSEDPKEIQTFMNHVQFGVLYANQERWSNNGSMARCPILYRLERQRRNGTRSWRIELSA